MTKNHTKIAGRDHALLGAGAGWEHRGRRNGENIEIEMWRRHERVELSRAGLRYLLATASAGTPEARKRDEALIDLVARGILVLRERDRIPLSDEQAFERARNIVAALQGGYYVDSLEGEADPAP